MKNFILSVLTVLIATVFIAAMPTEKEAAIYEDTLRLHILANSDSKEDQELKLKIRDGILERFGKKLGELNSSEDAELVLLPLLPEIEACAEKIANDEGFSYSVSARLSEEWFDTREYEDFTLPKGIYSSLIIEVGAAEGKNWWCVMFPPLCLDIASEKAPADDALINYSKEEISLISHSKYNIKFKILELLSGSIK